MAQFNADILLSVKGAKRIEAEINKIDQKLKKLEGKGILGDKQTRVERKLLESQKRRLQVQDVIEKKNRNITVGLQKQATLTKQIAANEKQAAAAATKRAAETRKASIDGFKKKFGPGISGAAISASFPLLTGGSGTESILGAAGGVLGAGLLGPLGSFAGGIGGSAIGRLITDAEELNKSLAKLNVSLRTVGTASQITGDDLGKLAIQLGVAKDEAITLIESFNGLAAAGEAAALARQFGNVGGASTAEAIAAAAQDEVSALNAIEQLRGVISLEAAQQLQDTLEQEGVQTTIAGILDTVLKLNQDIAVAQAEQVTFADRLKSVWLGISDIILGLDGFKTPGQIAQDRVDALGDNDTTDRLNDLRNFLEQQRKLREQFKPQKTPRGRSGGGALPQSKELQLRQQILKTELSLSEIERKRAALQFTELGATRAKQRALQENLPKQIQILELQRQQALATSKVPEDNILINKLYDERLNKIVAENSLLLEQNRIKEQQLVLQRDLVALRNEQQTGGIVQGLERGIEDANSRSSSEMLSLRIKQLRRQEDLIGGINEKLAEQRLIEAGGDAKKAEAAKREIGFLTERKAAIEALLPALNQAEQQQLRFNQAFAAVTPAVNSLVGGLQEVVAGTKTAEETFADFLNTIADQLISTAATMIAQYIAIGIARLFATGGSPGGGIPFGGGGDLGIAKGGGFGPSFFGLADGGFVTSPTQATVGEGGQPEYVIPANKMDSAMSRYSTGARGDAVVGGANAVESSDSLPAEQPSQINISGGVMQVDNTNYIRQDQIPAIVDQASKQGEARALRRLQMSPTARRKVGV